MASVYDFLDPVNFIDSRFRELKKRNPSFSLRAWARQLGMKSHGPLHAILKKQRKIPKKMVPKLIKTLKLTETETKYFETMVDLDRAKSIDEKEYYKARLNKLSPVPLREINDIEAYRYITDPLHIALAEMTQLKNFEDNAFWVRQHLRIAQEMREIESMLGRLKSLGVIKEENGKMIKPVEHIYTKYDIPNETVQNYHKLCSQLAVDQISRQSVDEREYNTIAFNIKKEILPELKVEIREFINALVDKFEAKPHEGDETYQLNVQFFSLSK